MKEVKVGKRLAQDVEKLLMNFMIFLFHIIARSAQISCTKKQERKMIDEVIEKFDKECHSNINKKGGK